MPSSRLKGTRMAMMGVGDVEEEYLIVKKKKKKRKKE